MREKDKIKRYYFYLRIIAKSKWLIWGIEGELWNLNVELEKLVRANRRISYWNETSIMLNYKNVSRIFQEFMRVTRKVLCINVMIED